MAELARSVCLPGLERSLNSRPRRPLRRLLRPPPPPPLPLRRSLVQEIRGLEAAVGVPLGQEVVLTCGKAPRGLVGPGGEDVGARVYAHGVAGDGGAASKNDGEMAEGRRVRAVCLRYEAARRSLMALVRQGTGDETRDLQLRSPGIRGSRWKAERPVHLCQTSRRRCMNDQRREPRDGSI